MKHDKQDRQIWYPNGSMAHYTHLEHPMSLRGPSNGWFCIDEAQEPQCEAGFHELRHTLRRQGTRQGAFIMSNPEGFNYIYRTFELGAETKPWKFSIYHFTIWDNPYLSKEFINDILASYPPDSVWYKRYVLGEFCGASGSAFPMFNENIHVTNTLGPYPPKGWVCGVAVDPGMRHPTAALWLAQDPDTGDVYVYREYEMTDLTIAQNAANILEISADDPISFWVMDPKAAEQRQATNAMKTKDIYQHYGLPAEPCDAIPINPALQKIAILLSNQAAEKNPEVPRGPCLYIHAGCAGLIQQLDRATWDDKRTTTGREVLVEMKDDLLACLRYGIQTLPIQPMKRINLQPMTQEEELYLHAMKANTNRTMLQKYGDLINPRLQRSVRGGLF